MATHTSKGQFSGLLTCANCGKHFRRRIANASSKYAKPAWLCSTFATKGKRYCNNKQIPEAILIDKSSIRKSRKEHADSLNADGTVVIRDIIFNTPSGAANFIRGGACNGKTYWRTASDQPLSDFISYRKNNSYN